MGNTVVKSRIINFITRKYPIYLPLPKNPRPLEHYKPINFEIIKELIIRKMAPARGRAPKAAAGNSANAKTKVEKAPEVEEGSSDQEMEESPVEQKKMVGKGRKLKETKEDVGAEEDLPKAKRGRKTKVQEEKADEDESKEKKAVGKGKKKEEESAVEEDTKKKPLRGKKTVTAVKDENDDDEEIAMKPKKGGKKPVLKEDEKDKEAEKKPSARGRKKLAAKEENVEEADEEEHTKPAAKRGKKPTNVKSAGGENGAANNGDSAAKPAKSRKKNIAEVAASPEVDEEEISSPEEDEAPAKPVAKRGKKPAATAAPGPSEEKNGAVDEDEAPAKPAAKRGRKVAAAAAREVSEEKNGSAEEGEAEKLAPKRIRKPVLATPQDDDEDNEPEKPKRVRKTGAAAKNAKAAKGKESKAAKAKQNEDAESDEEAEPPVKKTKAEAKAPKNKVDTNLEEIDFTCEKENPKGEKPNFKIVSWNVGGARAVVKKKGIEYLLKEDADVIVMQETKATEEQMNDAIELPGYKFYYVDSEEAGYAGAALYSKKEPVNVTYGIENSKCNNEGRLITAEFENFYILNVYVPNAGRKLVTMEKRLEWNKEFKAYVKQLDAKKPVFVCGDMNVAHQEIDLSNPKTNTKNAGFTKEERDGLTDFLAAGFVDTYRHLYPEKSDAYTFWSYMSNARAKNVGWRLDYFIVSERLKENICDNVMRSGVFGSDHCPVVLFANV